MKSISNAAAFQAVSLMIGCKPNTSSMVACRKNASQPIEKNINHEHPVGTFRSWEEARILSFTLPIDQQL